MSYPEGKFTVDLGVTHRRDPCPEHKTSGFDGDCDACDTQPYSEVPVPELSGFCVVVKNPRVLAYGKKKTLFADVPKDAPEGAAQQRLERIVTGLIVSWNLKDTETGEDLPIPSDDSSALDRAPDIIGAVFSEIGRHQREAALPKANATV